MQRKCSSERLPRGCGKDHLLVPDTGQVLEDCESQQIKPFRVGDPCKSSATLGRWHPLRWLVFLPIFLAEKTLKLVDHLP